MFSPLLRPLPHGALGIWDEIINLIPIVVGVLLLLYLYRAHRRRQSALPPESETDPALGQTNPQPADAILPQPEDQSAP